MAKKIAIIGYSFRLPQTTRETFWDDLCASKNMITEIPEDRWSFENHLHPDKNHPGTSYTFKAGTLGDISGFDAEFFGISPREAAVVDPQQRYLLEMTWEAIEHAGIKPCLLKKSNTGVYLGMSSIDYAFRMTGDLSTVKSSTATGNTTSVAANRISYTFDLNGPSLSLDTACSSSLYAFHHACQAIRCGEVSTAITGGISLLLHPFSFVMFAKATMLSPDGESRFCDASANGYVRAEGGGIFLLKDYDQAINDGDMIHAIVAGSAVNTDGYKSGITIPSWHAQQNLMAQAYEKANIKPDQIDYLEAHGTGTPVGDPIETRAIGQALAQYRKKPLNFGSIKANLGHLEPASGVAGLVKALHVLKHRAIPPTSSMKTPNPNILFDEWNIRLTDKLTPLKASGQLTVGINSFGFGGANAHVILQSHELSSPANTNTVSSVSKRLPWIITGKNQQALKENSRKLADHLNVSSPLYDIAWHYATHKQRLNQGAIFFAENHTQVLNRLNDIYEEKETKEIIYGKSLDKSKGAVFVYSGNGCQWEGMGNSLLQQSTQFRQYIDEVDKIFSKFCDDFSIKEELALLNGRGRYDLTEVAQPTLFAMQVAITRYLNANGVYPVAVTGHSVGEVAAAWACGSLSLEDAVTVIYYRSHYQGKTKGSGCMTAVSLSKTEMHDLLHQLKLDSLHIAGENSDSAVTIAGNETQLTILENHLVNANIFHARLPLDYAFHSPAMDSIRDDLLISLNDIKPRKSKIPFISTVRGDVLNTEKLDTQYWWENIREPVQFKDAINYLMADRHNCFIEIGAHPVLRHYLAEQLKIHQMEAQVYPTLTRHNGDLSELQYSIGQTLLAQACNLDHFFPVEGKKLELPTNVWQHEKYWYEPTTESYQILERYPVHPLLGAPLPRAPFCWESHISKGTHQWLKGHNVGGSTVLPGAAFTEIALSAASYYKSENVIEIEDLEILSPLILDDELGKVVQTRITNSGHIEISSRGYNLEEQWRLHVKAKVVYQPIGMALSNVTNPEKPQTPEDFDIQKHYALTDKVGLNYQGAFKSVFKGWTFDDVIFAELDLSNSFLQGLDKYYLHPGLLDSAIQLIVHQLAEQINAVSGVAFVPISFERVTCINHKGNPPSFVLLRCLQHSPHSLLTSIELYDANISPLAVIENLRYRAVKLQDKKQTLSYLDYHLIPAPQINKSIDILGDRIHSVLSKSFYSFAENQKLYQNEFLPLIDSLVQQAITEQFIKFNENDPIRFTELALEYFENSQCLKPQLNSVFKYAYHHELISFNNNKIRIDDGHVKSGEVDSELIWNTLIREYPDYFEETFLIGSFILDLAKLLNSSETGDTSQVDSSDFYNRYFKAQHGRYCLKSLQNIIEIIREIQDNLSEGERFSMCEIAHSKAYIGPSIIPELDSNRCDFTFFSPNESSVAYFNDTHHQFSLATAKRILDNNETDLIDDHHAGYQLAIVTLDSNDIQLLTTALKSISNHLCDNAILLISGISSQSWHQLVFDSSFFSINSDRCLSLLQQQDCYEIKTITSDIDIEDFFIISAKWKQKKNIQTKYPQGSSTDNNKYCIYFGTEASNEKLIKNALNKYKNSQKILLADSLEKFNNLLHSLSTDNKNVTHIIYANGLGHSNDPFELQVKRCTELTEIHKLIDSLSYRPTLTVLTQNVVAMYRDQAFEQLPSDSALWGFSRTLMNEASSYSIRLIDLPKDLSLGVVNKLCDELFYSSQESEIFFDAQGNRFAPRLRIQKHPFYKFITTDNTRTHSTLQFDVPGQLKNLFWKSTALPDLGADQIEIEIKATGLNFRDVMYALGLLSDEAIENGFAGASLGLEFAGRISAVGKNVKKFNVNDRVVGFNSSCFSDHTVCTPDTLVKIPFGMSYASAATIPTTFLTVYYSLKYLANIQPGERILIHGAAGGVGLAAIQIAQWLGAEIYATVGSKDKKDFITLLGVNRIYNSRDFTFADKILNDTGDLRGVDVVLNSLAGEAINLNLKLLRPFGRFLELGKRDFYENTSIGLRPFRNNISYFGIDADQLQKDRPELAHKLFKEVIHLFENGDLFPLPYTEFTSHDVINAFRYMQQAKQIGKVIVSYPDQPHIKTNFSKIVPDISIDAIKLNPNYAYLITGGLGGFGLKTAQWLAEKGARKLILLSRRGAASEEAQEFIQYAQNNNIDLHPISCDVTDKNALTKVYRQCSNEIAPIKGIIHAATVINDDLVLNLNKEKIYNSLNAKISGAMNLHEVSKNDSLDFFVLYSSVTTLWGNPGQSSYVAANHWLEAFAAYRKSIALPATCVRWGAIDDVGFLQRNEKIKSALAKRTGSEAIHSDDALDFLGKALVKPTRTLGVMELKWGVLKKFLPTANDGKFSEINRTIANDEHEQDTAIDLKQLYSEMSFDELKQYIVDKIRTELAEILMISENKIDLDVSIYDMGMDSLMGLELVTGLEEKLGIQIPVMALSETPKIPSLADKVIQLINTSSDNEKDMDIYNSVKVIASAHSSELDDENIRKLADSIGQSGS